MIELRIRPMETDQDGWTEVCLIVEQVGSDEDGDGETVGYVRQVEGTENGPVTWWGARVVEEDRTHERRFSSLEAALLALALRPHSPHDSKRLLGW